MGVTKIRRAGDREHADHGGGRRWAASSHRPGGKASGVRATRATFTPRFASSVATTASAVSDTLRSASPQNEGRLCARTTRMNGEDVDSAVHVLEEREEDLHHTVPSSSSSSSS